MPELSRFYGIVIYMYYLDHEPPHFHAKYGVYEAIISLPDGQFFGEFPKTAKRLVKKWLKIHQQELLSDWELARSRKALQKIAPLE